MNDFNILWIDDDWSGVTESRYNLLLNVKSILLRKNSNIRISMQVSIGNGFMAIDTFNEDNNRNLDLVIVDLDFKNEYTQPNGQRFNFIDVINKINKKNIKFVIYTNEENSFGSDLELVKSRHKDLLIGIYSKNAPDKFINDIITLSQFTPLNIIHLSDFHFNSLLKDADKKNQNELFNKLIVFLSSEYKHNPFSHIIFSGDFAFKNPSADLIECSKIIREIVNNTIQDYTRLLIVPGNHDIIWDDFDKNKLSHHPFSSFYQFFQQVYDNKKDFISSLVGYNEKTNGFDPSYDPDSFCYSREYRNGLVKIIGLNSVLSDEKLKGKGRISENAISFLKNCWSTAPQLNEFRIVIFHHNVLPPFSVNALDESDCILNAGEIIELLASLGCDLLLNGHCHHSYLYSFSYSGLNRNGFSDIKYLTTISTSTTGGTVPNQDRAKSFNLINICSTVESSKKSIQLTPVYYDSTKNIWEKSNKLNHFINYNK